MPRSLCFTSCYKDPFIIFSGGMPLSPCFIFPLERTIHYIFGWHASFTLLYFAFRKTFSLYFLGRTPQRPFDYMCRRYASFTLLYFPVTEILSLYFRVACPVHTAGTGTRSAWCREDFTQCLTSRLVLWTFSWSARLMIWSTRIKSVSLVSSQHSYSLTLEALWYFCMNHGDQSFFSIWNNHKWLS